MNSSDIVSRRILSALMALIIVGCGKEISVQPEAQTGSPYMFVWAGDLDGADSDFLAVIDARAGAPTYGDVIATLPVDVKQGMPHHTEYEFPENGLLFADAWLAGRSLVFDLTDPRAPKLAASFDGAGGYSYPHSYARLKNGNVLATFQGRDGVYGPPGGLVELEPTGKPVRSVSTLAPDRPVEKAWAYSLAVSPTAPRAAVTLAEMGMPPWKEYERTKHVQIWNTDDLRLIAEIELPEEESGWRHLDPAEPRFMADGTVFVSTFSCGLYRIADFENDAPRAEFVFGFPGGNTFDNPCAVPVIVGKYWIQTVTEINGLIVLDLSNPAAPVEVSRFMLDHDKHMMPHWLAADRKGGRLVLTGMDTSWVVVLDFDPATGVLSYDMTFGGGDGVSFDRQDWPHGSTGPAFVHGTLFGG